MTIVGIDPGTRFLGYAIINLSGHQVLVRSCGVITSRSSVPFSERLFSIANELEQVLASHRPDAIVVEKVFLGKNVESAFKLGHIRGVCLALAAKVGAEVVEYAVRQVKKGVTGNGNAAKEHVQMVLRQEFALPEKLPLDASDALAMASYHARKILVQQRWQNQGRGQHL